MQIETTKVVIVGAGPTGLTMAACLLQLGVDFVIIDKKAGPTKESKAMVVHARSMEVFDTLGIADRFAEKGEVTGKMNFVIKGKVQNTIQIGQFGTGLTKFPFILTLEQSKTEQILVDCITEKGGSIHWGAEFIDIKNEDNSSALIEYHNNRKLHQLRAEYVIACDGATSPIRKRLNIPFKGSTESNLFYVADVKMKSETFSKKELYISFLKEGFALIFGMEGEDHFRIIGVVPKEFENNEDLDFSDFSHFIKEQLYNEVEFQDTYWYSSYRVHSRAAESFQVGNVFLAGDACHIHTPAGGQGMNTGIQDAYNLAWKLSRVIKGKSQVSLLDSYHKERKANALNLLKTTDRTFEFMMDDNFISNFAKRYVFPTMTKLVSSTSLGSRLVFPTVSQLGITYKEESLSNFFKRGKVRSGDRMPFADNPEFDSITLGKALTDDYRLLCFGVSDTKEFDAVENLQVIQIQPDIAIKKLVLSKESFILLRPDNHIAYIGQSRDKLKKTIA